MKEYVAVKDDFFVKPLEPLAKARLAGSKCRQCGEVFLGKAVRCQQCQSGEMEDTILSKAGKLFSYTVVRNRPPGDYKGPDNPFQPFAVGLIELPDGVRVMAPMTGVKFEDIKIGMPLELSVEELYTDEKGRGVVAYKFGPPKTGKEQ